MSDILFDLLHSFLFVQDEVLSLPLASNTIVLVNKDNVYRMVATPGDYLSMCHC